MGRARAGSRHRGDLRRVDMDGMGVPDVWSFPIEVDGISDGPRPEPLPAEPLLVASLGEMRVEPDAELSGEARRSAHQFGSDGERRAGGDHDSGHRSEVGVVELFHGPGAILEDGDLVFYDGIGREPSGRLSQAHRASGDVESDPTLEAPATWSSILEPFGHRYWWSKAVVHPVRANSARPTAVAAWTCSGVIRAQTG